MSEIGAFHHIGIACRSLEREAAGYEALGYVREGDEFDDPGNGMRGVFLAGPGPRIELVENGPDSHVINPWLRRGSAMYHVAFEVDDIARAVEEQTQARAKVVVAPRPARAFGGRRIAFVMLRNRLLVELIAHT